MYLAASTSSFRHFFPHNLCGIARRQSLISYLCSPDPTRLSIQMLFSPSFRLYDDVFFFHFIKIQKVKTLLSVHTAPINFLCHLAFTKYFILTGRTVYYSLIIFSQCMPCFALLYFALLTIYLFITTTTTPFIRWPPASLLLHNVQSGLLLMLLLAMWWTNTKCSSCSCRRVLL